MILNNSDLDEQTLKSIQDARNTVAIKEDCVKKEVKDITVWSGGYIMIDIASINFVKFCKFFNNPEPLLNVFWKVNAR